SKWEEADQESKVIMELGIYSLAPNYRVMMHTRQSPEIIFQSNINQVWQVTDKDWVRIMQPPSQGGGWANTQPLQNLVDAYEMADGTSFDWNNPTHAANPYINRDPRFAATIIHDNSPWAGSAIRTYVGAGVDGLNYGSNGTRTGYYIGAKMLDETSTLITSYRPGSHFWIFMRYAETLLNYAEAQNEVLAAPDQSIYDAVNAIRQRPSVNMPPLPPNLTKEEMRQRIRHERRIEMALEDTRFWDIKRWRIGEEVMKAAYGMRVIRNGNNYTYEKFLIEDRVYRPAFDLFPIPLGEMLRNKALVQNPGYIN
ncbi:MAG TPA: RagB/SusD family nutrient uptake outer membrane protein, partial [Sphingobacterium sp.]|nr:RagB/SusD family nutrient uptake outer membrane protein [Sphingobacterium sp.]